MHANRLHVYENAVYHSVYALITRRILLSAIRAVRNVPFLKKDALHHFVPTCIILSGQNTTWLPIPRPRT
jgi:hypothetical protein